MIEVCVEVLLTLSMKKGSGGPKFHGFSKFIMNFQKIIKNEFWGDLEGAG